MMRFRELKHLPVVALVAVGLALAGCGGGGDGSLSTSEERQQQQEHEAQVAALQETIEELREALGLDPEGEDDPDVTVEELNETIADLRQQIAAAEAEAERMRMEAEAEAERQRMAAMAATAAKLYAGISAPTATDTDTEGSRFAQYVTTAGTPAGASVGDIHVAIDTTDVALSEDKDTTVAANYGWEGKRYADPAGGDSYEAVVYSDFGAPTMGAKFNSGTGDGNVGFATVNGMFTFDTGTNVGSRIASPRFTHAAGSHTFTLPENDQTGQTMIPISGSYYGVSGTYSCTPGTGACTVNKAAEGYVFANPSAWTFKATNPEARVTEMADTDYASYGWWIRKSADDKTYIASVFVDNKGTAPAAITGLNALNGTATYMGGAAGKYALSSSTGGMNDAGHFTARAMLEANFNAETIEGTIDNFMGADGESRAWSVKLNKAMISDTGTVAGTADGAAVSETNPNVGTVWTIGGMAGSKSGQWSGSLQDTAMTSTDGSGVPKVATGTFHSTYGQGNSMVGAFGANKQ